MGFIFKEDYKRVDPKVARNRAIMFSVPLALFGLFALVLLVHDGLLGGLNKQKAMGLLSAAIVCGGLILLIFGITAKSQALALSDLMADEPSPWLKRKEWVDGRIPSSSRRAVVLLWIIVGFWCTASAVFFLVVLPQQLHQGSHAAVFTLVLPVVGLAIFYFALNTSSAWRKFNRTIFAMAAVPAAQGGVLAGEIQVKTKMLPKHGFHLRLSCVRRTITGKSNNRQTSEKILWQDDKWLRADLPQTGSGTTGIPVFFKLPGNLPESAVTPGDGVHWKLEASAELRGPNFHAAFDVPVFKLPEPPAPADDPTSPYQMSLDDLRRQIRSLIQVNDLPENGREFVFPAARNPGFASGATVICLIWTVIIAVLVWMRAPLPFLLVVTAMDLLMVLFVLDLWFRHSRVVINSKGVTVERAWYSFKKEQRLQIGEIKNITTDVGATAGHAAYHDLRVHTRDGKEFVLAKNLNNKPEADWLVRQMIAALKQPS